MSSIIKVDTVQDTDGNNIINENANVITVGDAGDTVAVAGNVVKTNAVQAADAGNIISQSGTTITLGASGDTVNIAAGASLVGGGISWQSSIVTAATHTAVSGEGYWIDTTSNACTITLPAAPAVGDQIIFTDYARQWGTNAVTINQNSKKFQGNTSPNPVYDTNGQSVDIVYSGTTQGWIPNSDDDVTFETSQSYAAEYLVVAGGGSGGTGDGAGAGAGGHLTNFGGTAIQLTPGATYTATVGAGASGVPGSPKTRGLSGVNSSLSGTGITTVTSIGGGGGGTSSNNPDRNGLDGGSGGGGGNGGGSGGSGTSGQGNDGGDNAGGGGGAGAVGGGSPGPGGNGLANSITGSSVTRAGGGGSVQAPGGSGGGTAGVTNPGASSSAPANTGGGSGGSNDNAGGNGGSGVVILRMADADYSGTVSGSPTVATGVSGDTVITFNASGSYTA